MTEEKLYEYIGRLYIQAAIMDEQNKLLAKQVAASVAAAIAAPAESK